MAKTKIGDKLVFYKLTSSSKDFKQGKAVYVQKGWSSEGYSVYRTRIVKYGNKPFELGDGWNLYKGLELNTAIKAAKSALKYVD